MSPPRTATIPQGTQITGTFPGPPKKAGRSYRVRIHSTSPGYDGCCYCRRDASIEWTDSPEQPYPYALGDGHGKHCVRPRPATITWVGAGGYWHEAKLSDVELDETAGVP